MLLSASGTHVAMFPPKYPEWPPRASGMGDANDSSVAFAAFLVQLRPFDGGGGSVRNLRLLVLIFRKTRILCTGITPAKFSVRMILEPRLHYAHSSRCAVSPLTSEHARRLAMGRIKT